MTRAFKFAILAPLFALAACAHEDAPPPLAKLGKNAKVMAFGDSITRGYGVPFDASYPAQLAKMTGLQIINMGQDRDRAIWAVSRFENAVARERPDLVILCIGGNDILRKVPAEQIETGIRKMLDFAKAKRVPVIIIGMPRRLPVPLSHPLYAKLADEYGLWLEDNATKTYLFNDEYKSDLIHPNEAGYRLMAEAVAKLLKRAGAI